MKNPQLTNSKERLINLNKTIEQARRSKLYSKKLSNFSGKLKTLNEISLLPFTTKDDLRNHYPFGGLSVEANEIIEVHTSSGTTGKPTLSFYTKEDLRIGSRAISEAWANFGIGEQSKIQFIMSYGLFSGAMLNSYAIQKLGAFVLPAGILPTCKQIELMRDFKIDTVVATPGYLLYLYEYMQENNISRNSIKLHRAIAAGEVYSSALRSEIEKKLEIKVYDHYGLCEVNTGIAYECDARDGLHILDDYVIPEIIDSETGKLLSDGEYGELVLTSLKKEASPIIRYRTGDITCIKRGNCDCESNRIRIDRIKSRVDDLLFIKGIKINPHELKDFIVDNTRGKLFGSDIRILVKRNSINHRPRIRLSFKNEFKDFKNIIQKKIQARIGVRFNVEHVEPSYFGRETNTKVKLVEYI